MDSLDGRRALVTGASGGIGAAIARELARAGAKLVLTARRQPALEAIAAELGNTGIDIIVADLGTRGGAESLWTRARAGGPIDILVNNAGFGYFRRFDEVDWERNAELLQLNVMSLVELSRRFVADRKGASGRGYL
ncbi:MAG TPA: SDR family NAD(P)-dependent oxidoreductase, partial [Kofleriaceae bacterium]|nr:SDR family NAD(P)-dependent oxidoreductase [Kofleriaceae bacterium]